MKKLISKIEKLRESIRLEILEQNDMGIIASLEKSSDELYDTLTKLKGEGNGK